MCENHKMSDCGFFCTMIRKNQCCLTRFEFPEDDVIDYAHLEKTIFGLSQGHALLFTEIQQDSFAIRHCLTSVFLEREYQIKCDVVKEKIYPYMGEQIRCVCVEVNSSDGQIISLLHQMPFHTFILVVDNKEKINHECINKAFEILMNKRTPIDDSIYGFVTLGVSTIYCIVGNDGWSLNLLTPP